MMMVMAITGWVPLKVICNFPKVKKLSKDIRAVALALEGSELLVVSKATRVRRKVGGSGGGGGGGGGTGGVRS